MKFPRPLAIAALVVLGFAGCHRSSPTEQKVLGSWSFPTIDSQVTTTFNANHTLAGAIQTADETLQYTGHWRVEGDHLIQELEMGLQEKNKSPLRQTTREKILEISRDKMITDINTYTRAK